MKSFSGILSAAGLALGLALTGVRPWRSRSTRRAAASAGR